jgi:hypothetical protein
VKFMHSSDYYLRDIWFTLADGSTAKTCNCQDLCNYDKTIYLNDNQSLIGLATKHLCRYGH